MNTTQASHPRAITNFFFVFTPSAYKSTCCCGILGLRNAVRFLALFDLLSSLLCIWVLYMALVNARTDVYSRDVLPFVSLIVAMLLGVPALQSVLCIGESDALMVKWLYYGKVLQTFSQAAVELSKIFTACSSSSGKTAGDGVHMIIFTLVWLTLDVYVARIYFSFVNVSAEVAGQTRRGAKFSQGAEYTAPEIELAVAPSRV